jgi:hypothetical protein
LVVAAQPAAITQIQALDQVQLFLERVLQRLPQPQAKRLEQHLAVQTRLIPAAAIRAHPGAQAVRALRVTELHIPAMVVLRQQVQLRGHRKVMAAVERVILERLVRVAAMQVLMVNRAQQIQDPAAAAALTTVTLVVAAALAL